MKSDGDFCLGTVIVSAPQYGLALVASSGGSGELKDMYICHLPYTDSPMGAFIQQHIPDGSSVVFMKSAHRTQIGYIITAINETKEDPSDTLNGRVFYMTNVFTTRQSWEFKALIEKMKNWGGASFLNYSNAVDKDVLPGDVDTVNADGPAAMHVGRYLVQIKGSPVAFIDVSGIANQIRMVASKISEQTMTMLSQKTDAVSVTDTAASVAEAFGLPEGPVLDGDENKSEGALPLYRMQRINGPAVDGEESMIVAFPFAEDGKPLETHTSETEPPILSKERTSMTGDITKASAAGLTFVKSSHIKGVMQYPYNVDGVTEKEELMPPFQKEYEDEDGLQAVSGNYVGDPISDAAINKIIEKLLTGDYFTALKNKMTEAGLMVSEKSLHDYMGKSSKGDTEETEEVEKTGPTEAQEYSLPDYIDLTDPRTGKLHRYYDSDSFISQEADGSILICDGYGSEIRMSRGNIYISPALDLFMRPGRDMSAMVPRHQSFDCQGFCTINSMKSIYIRAVQDLQMVGATGENGGKVSLECNNPGTGEHGLLLKGLGNVALVGKNVYLGINKGTSNSANRVEEPENSGSIIIDACGNGTIMEHSGSHVINSHIFTAVSEGDGKNSAISIGSNSIQLYTENVVIPAKVILAQLDGTQTTKIIRDGQTVEVELNTATEPQLIVKGAVGIEGNLKVDGSAVVLGAVIQRTSYYVYQSMIKDDVKVFENLDLKKSALNKNMTDVPGVSNIALASKSLYQDHYIVENGFKFPDNYGVAPEIVVPGMVWQSNTMEQDINISDYTWNEEYMVSITGSTTKTTACYPGYEVWESAKVTARGYKSFNLNTSYITNTKKETENG